MTGQEDAVSLVMSEAQEEQNEHDEQDHDVMTGVKGQMQAALLSRKIAAASKLVED
jgi:hypothetical protein